MPVVRLELSDLAATQRFGRLLAAQLQAGDVIALSGALGAGKSALARAIIQAVDPTEDDVPSPTFTLVQHYALADETPLWQIDPDRLAYALVVRDSATAIRGQFGGGTVTARQVRDYAGLLRQRIMHWRRVTGRSG